MGISLIYSHASGMPHIVGKRSRQRLQLCLRPHFNQRYTQEVIGLQNHGSSNFKNFGTPNLKVVGQNDIWVQAPWLGIENTIRGKLMASPKSKPWWILWVAHGLSMHQKCSNYALTNLLFGLCRSVWIIDLLIICPNPHTKALACPFTSKMLRAKEYTPTPYPFIVFTFGLAIESIKEFGGASTS